ncbi:Tnt-2 [Aphelenchoides fujianensis]|nr:Tnt-2 [Aphelenchoides fujianensis]
MADEEQYSGEEEEYEEEEEEEEVAAAEEPKAAEEPAPAEDSAANEAADEPAADDTAAEAQSEQPKLRRQLTEAEAAMLAAKKRHEEEEEAKSAQSEQRRKEELANVEQELEELKRRQQERKAQREVEEREFAERRRQDDERRRQQEEERKAKIEEQKRLKEEEKIRRQQIMAGGFVTSTVGNKRKERTAEQQAEAKRNYLASIQKPDISNLLPNDLKAKIKQLHAKILRLEGEKFDLEQRAARQEYDLKELSERESQTARKKAIERGVEVEETAGVTRPPKIQVASKHDRQRDSRSFGDRKNVFLPMEPPAPKIVHGTARPPPEWGRKQNVELENIRKNLEAPLNRYTEVAPAEGDAAKPPVDPIPLQLPTEGDEA